MLDGTSRGLLLISIDVDPGPEAVGDRNACRHLAGQLLERLDRQGVAATWALGEPLRDPLLGRLASAGTPQELALLGDPSWIDQGRAVLASELSRRAAAIRHQGWELNTLALRGASLDRDLDLLVKHRIGLVRTSPGDTGQLQSRLAPQSVRYGVWQAPAAFPLPAEGWLRQVKQRRALAKAVAKAQLMHVALELPAVVARGGELAEFERLIAAADRYRQQTLLEVNALRRLVTAIRRPHTLAPTRSLLRAA